MGVEEGLRLGLGRATGLESSDLAFPKIIARPILYSPESVGVTEMLERVVGFTAKNKSPGIKASLGLAIDQTWFHGNVRFGTAGVAGILSCGEFHPAPDGSLVHVRSSQYLICLAISIHRRIGSQ